MRLISTICGAPGVGRGVWGRWLATRSGGGTAGHGGVVAPNPTAADASRALGFGAVGPDDPLLFVPAAAQLAEALVAARTCAEAQAGRPTAVVADPEAVTDLLLGAVSVGDDPVAARRVLIGGLVVLDRDVEAVLDRSVLHADERPLYRSDHERVLHTLLINDGTITEPITINQRVRGHSTKSYEVDLWCAELALAIEVDGAQHISCERQRRRDAARDADLAARAIRTVRVHAAEVMSDPTAVLAYVRDQLQRRRRERAR